MFTVLFVCSGNTCRSPMAEMILKHLLGHNGSAREISVYSCGIYALDGGGMSEHAKTVLEKAAVAAEDFSVKRLDAQLIESANLILCVTKGHVAAINTFFAKAAGKTYQLGAFAGDGCDVSDPFGLGVQEYEACFLQLRGMLEQALPKIISLAKEDGI